MSLTLVQLKKLRNRAYYNHVPQIDKATFFPIVFWTFVLYTGGFLIFNLSFMFRFLSAMKLATKRAVSIHLYAFLTKRLTNAITFFPWISL